MYQDIDVRRDEQNNLVLMVTLNRPAQRNAMSAILVDEMLTVVERTEQDDSVAVILIKGEGNGFCAGSDLAGLAAMTAPGRAAFEAASGELARRIGTLRTPVLAAVHGFAIGGGLTLAAACDIVVAAPDSRWSLPEVPIGLFPAWGLSAVDSRIGRPTARRLAWGIETLDGSAAHEIGLVDFLAQEPSTMALGLSRRLADLPHQQVASVKDYFMTPRHGAEADRQANRLFMAACSTPQAAASFERFNQKRV